MTTVRFLTLLTSFLILFICSIPGALSVGGKKPASGEGKQQEKMEIRDKWALLVGINRFSDPALPPLKFAQKSSADLARAMKDMEVGHFAQNHVLVLNGPDASKAAIEQAFNDWLFKKAMPDDLVVIYFNTRLLKNKAGDAVICANDTLAAQPESTGLNVLELLTNARQRVGSTHMLCLLDTNPCSESDAKSEHDLKWLAKTSGVALFSAAELFRQSRDDAASMQTGFMHYFLEAFKGSNGNFPVAMLAEYVWQKLQETAKAGGGAGQTPVLTLPSEQSGTVSIPLGIMVRSSIPPRLPAFGHSLDSLALDRPDIIAPTLNPAKSSVVVHPRNPGKMVTAAAASRPNFVQTPPPAAARQPATTAPPSGTQPPSPSTGGATHGIAPTAGKAETADDDDDNFDPNLDLNSYVARIKEDIQKKWQVPKGFESRRVVTAFTITRDGRILNAQILESSGNAAVDESALSALKSASPLAPLPQGAPRSIDLKYLFDWKTKVGNP